jgi:hypothetical protein
VELLAKRHVRFYALLLIGLRRALLLSVAFHSMIDAVPAAMATAAWTRNVQVKPFAKLWLHQLLLKLFAVKMALELAQAAT